MKFDILGERGKFFGMSGTSIFGRRIAAGWRVIWLVLALAFAVGKGWGQTGLTLRGDAVDGENGHDVTMLFRTQGFWQITEGMGTIQWDSSVIDFVSAGDFGIPEIDGGTFTRIPEGKLTFDWTADGLLGNTLPDGSVLFSLTFNVRGGPGDSTAVAFTDGWTPVHFESVESDNLPFTSVSGTASVVPEPAVWALLLLGGAALFLGRCGVTKRVEGTHSGDAPP